MFRSFTRIKLCDVSSKRFNRLYHSLSENGVYGYRPKPKKTYEVAADILESRQKQANVYQWVQAYRKHGHRIANTNPVAFLKLEEHIYELDRKRYGLHDEEHVINTQGIINSSANTMQIKDLELHLKQLYCKTISAEFDFIESEHEREWLQENYEKYLLEPITNNVKIEIIELMIKSQAWDHYLAKKHPNYKRYGGEGAETALAFFRQIFESTSEMDLKHIVLGMPHRGKLNLITVMCNTKPAKVFRKIRGLSEFPDDAKCMGDIASHFHVSEDLSFNGKSFRFSMLHNPSHLEAVNPVSMGKTRSKQQSLCDGVFSNDINSTASATLNIQLHGDAAFSGQGINQEMLMMAATPHFDIGGTIHMIVNNQVGFTTPADRGRSTRYCTDLAKSINAPVFHVNADDPEGLTSITKLVFEYWKKFQKDVFIDLNCFRRWGHNELDDPTFTNPLLYQIIHSRKSFPDTYADRLISDGVTTNENISKIKADHNEHLTNEFDSVDSYKPDAYYFKKQWSGLQQAPNSITYWDTGLDYNILKYIGEKSIEIPKDFSIHPHLLKTHVNARLKKLENATKIDWATAETFAIGSLMYQGHNVRISGEDVGRGTFSQRHAMLVDQKTNEMFIPLNSLEGGKNGKLELANSILSEEAVLAYEYGMSIDNPHNLIIWEAQFGDFFNGAQIQIDTFIVSGETKWMYCSGLVMLLPHGYDGMASEHSSCRIERFLQQTDSKENSPDGDDVNFQIINPTTPAQYYHALRRQIIRNFRKPLVIIGPKTLLRLSDATSSYDEFLPGKTFQPVLGDNIVVDKDRVQKVILCSGKHYYNLNAERNEKNFTDVAIVRVESLCPFPVAEINQELDKYKNAKMFIWSQEEHKNMGPWSFIKPRFENMCGRKIKYYGRAEGATPATGVSIWHKAQTLDVVSGPFKVPV